MDWRNGSRQNATGSAFRGIGSRGRGRGRGALPNNRVGHLGTHSPTVAHATSLPPPLPPTQAPLVPPINPPASKAPSRSGFDRPPRHAPSHGHLDTADTSKAPVAPSAELTTKTGDRPEIARRSSHNHTSIAIPLIPSVNLDPSTLTIPGSPRPKPSRKRSHNRARSTSKVSTTPQVSAAPSNSSLEEKGKEAYPHTGLASAPANVQSFDLRTNIDTLVERVRAMAMAGSAVDKEKDRDGIHTSNDGHIDWAGDEDDTLPDLDDWVKPKGSQHKDVEQTNPDNSLEKLSLPPVEDTANPRSSFENKDMQGPSGLNEPRLDAIKQQDQVGKDVKKLKVDDASKTTDMNAGPGRAKTKGRHGRKKSIASEASGLTLATQTLAGPEAQSSESLGPITSRPPLVHPLPPKPSGRPVRGSKTRGSAHGIQPLDRERDNATSEKSLGVTPREELVKALHTRSAGEVIPTTSEPQVPKGGLDANVDWTNAPQSTQNPTLESVREALDAPSFNVGAHSDTHTRKRAFDPNADWSMTPRAPYISLTRRSPTHPTCSSAPSGHTFSPPNLSPSTSLYDHFSGSYPHHNTFSRLSSTSTTPQPSSNRTRLRMDSPERSPHRRQDKDGLTHLRAHSSPQAGSGTRNHTSRPVITLDALSRISRTLGVSGASTPPRGSSVEVVVAD